MALRTRPIRSSWLSRRGAGNEEGLLTVHRGAALAGAGWAPTPVPPAQQVVGTADPLLLLDTHMPKLQAVRWNPADENVVGAVSAATRQLLLYDLQHTQVGCAATRLLHSPPTLRPHMPLRMP